jgi:uncharacterized protein (TIGR02757 family)
MVDIKKFLNDEIRSRDTKYELTSQKPDPLMIAKRYNDEYISLVCALFAYGDARQIVKFLSSLDFDLLNSCENSIKKELKGFYYRFQNEDDIIAFFITLRRLKQNNSLEDIFKIGYKKQNNILDGIDNLIQNITKINPYKSRGYKFLISSPLKRDKQNNIKQVGNSPYKRYNMFLRWVVRKDNIDMGLWSGIDKKDLILPLDTHTFKIGQKLGLLKRKTYDLKSAILLTNKLKEFDKYDPVKYDFAIYRLGQERFVL